MFQDFVSRTSPCCLISTDLAARGIDFVVQPERPRGPHKRGSGSGSGSGADVGLAGDGSSAVDLVVQFDCPDSVETHIHRVGRTARLTRKGQAVLLLLPSEVSFLEQLQAKGVRYRHLYIHPRNISCIYTPRSSRTKHSRSDSPAAAAAAIILQCCSGAAAEGTRRSVVMN